MKSLLAPLTLLILFSSLSAAMSSDRLVGLSISEYPNLPYVDSLNAARAAGVGYVALPLVWNDVETTPGIYAPDPDWISIAAAYYPSIGLPYALELNPIDSVADRRPGWLQDKSWDSPEVINAYLELLEFALKKTLNSDLVSITIGNEVDVLLGTNEKAWAAYTQFIKAVAERIHELRPGLQVAVKTTFGSLGSDQIDHVIALQAEADIVQLTYSGLDDFFAQGVFAAPPISDMVPVDIEKMTNAFPDKEIHLAEIGFPAGDSCFRGEAGQVEFIDAFFNAWDNHSDQISAVMWEWMYDADADAVANWQRYYGIEDKCFTEYLATLGLKNTDGTQKLGWETFVKRVSEHLN